jgi:hypothetical protein
MNKISDKFIPYITLLSGLSISAVAIYYSVTGLIAIFPAAALAIVIMGVTLEIGKLVATVWLKQNWVHSPYWIKAPLLLFVFILMLITSMGIFGFLSKAHSDQSLVSGDVQSKVAIYDEKIKAARENIESDRTQLRQMDEAVEQVMARSTTESGAERSNIIRRNQQRDRNALAQDIEANQKIIVSLNDESAPLRADLRKVEADVGPIKYIAAFFYNTSDQTILEKAVTWVILILITVFDPLAVMLLLASQYSFQKFSEQQESNEYTPDPYVADVGEKPTAYEQDNVPLSLDAKSKFEDNTPLSASEPDLENNNLYVQNEEQNQSNLWTNTTTGQIITQEQYLEAAKNRSGV